MNEFFQNPPVLDNTFESDSFLKSYLQGLLPSEIQSEIFDHLKRVGNLAVNEWLEWAAEAERVEPLHTPFDAWGRRLDSISMTQGWKNLEAAAATEGVVATAYDRKYGPFSRVYQLALLYLFHPSSAFVSCPLAMTDGAARALELYANEKQKEEGWSHLLSRDPKVFWTSGQWMTERSGGSDVSGTETIAKKSGNRWLLSGTKWFTSATTSQVTMLLARPEGAEAGSRGLSLFFAPVRRSDGQLNGMEILRLKDKLGSRAMPTAEIKLKEASAELIGDIGGGVKKIAAILNITRIYNSICAVGQMRRGLDWAKSYSRERMCFGKRLIDHPLHQTLLADLERTVRDCFALSFFAAELLGKDEVNQATPSEKVLLRALTPIVKLYTGKKCVEVISEVVEIFGGAGYVEDTGIPVMLRNAQVFPIWEGTTNILSLDFLRAIEKDQAWPVIVEFWKSRGLQPSPRTMEILGWAKTEPEKFEAQAREFAFLVAEKTIQALSKHDQY